jgi:hypothetical protein
VILIAVALMVRGHAIPITEVDRPTPENHRDLDGKEGDRPKINRRIRRKDLEGVLSTGPCGDQIRIHDSISTLSVALKSENMHFIRLVTDVCPPTPGIFQKLSYL